MELRGYVTRAEVLHAYSTCAVVAVPSTYEGFGYAAAQALCAGTPVIVSNRSSLPEVAASDAPIVPLESSEGWIATLRDALSGSLAMQANEARPPSIQRFSWQTAAQKMFPPPKIIAYG